VRWLPCGTGARDDADSLRDNPQQSHSWVIGWLGSKPPLPSL